LFFFFFFTCRKVGDLANLLLFILIVAHFFPRLVKLSKAAERSNQSLLEEKKKTSFAVPRVCPVWPLNTVKEINLWPLTLFNLLNEQILSRCRALSVFFYFLEWHVCARFAELLFVSDGCGSGIASR
jgi:hypothetical protein